MLTKSKISVISENLDTCVLINIKIPDIFGDFLSEYLKQGNINEEHATYYGMVIWMDIKKSIKSSL